MAKQPPTVQISDWIYGLPDSISIQPNQPWLLY